MPMNLVIQKRRKEFGLTQEQVAEYLNVSIPAVSKWENGTTCPDIGLLPSLARLLKIDLNTLFCFYEDLTKQDISHFCKELADIVHTDSIAAAFELAIRKLQEYPYNEELLQCVAFQVDGLLRMSGLSMAEMRQYEKTVVSWYRRLAESNDIKISNSANYMLVGRYIRNGEYERAQETLDLMPDRNDLTSSLADKLMLQTTIYMHQGKAERAAKDLESALLIALNKVQILLYKMVDAELAAGEQQAALYIADKADQMAKMFDLWEYNSFVASLQIALAEKNTGKCLQILRSMLEAMLVPWDMAKSPLFQRISESANSTDPKQMLPAILQEMEREDENYAFLQSSNEFRLLIAEYRELTSDKRS